MQYRWCRWCRLKKGDEIKILKGNVPSEVETMSDEIVDVLIL